PIKRWAAGDALARSALKDNKDAILKLLEDENVTVRRRVSEALIVDAKENGSASSSVPALIKIISSGSADDILAAEDVLVAMAGEKAPKEPEDRDAPKAMQRYQQEWEAWWKDASPKFDLKKIDFEGAGRNYTLIGMQGYSNNKRYTGRLIEMDKDGKAKWEIEDLLYPVYACKTKRDRVLICEHNGNKVTERDTKNNKIIWKKEGLSQPVSCERLNNGNTFIATRNEMMEVDRDGKVV